MYSHKPAIQYTQNGQSPERPCESCGKCVFLSIILHEDEEVGQSVLQFWNMSVLPCYLSMHSIVINHKSLGEKENKKHQFFSKSGGQVKFDFFSPFFSSFPFLFRIQVILWSWEWLKNEISFLLNGKSYMNVCVWCLHRTVSWMHSSSHLWCVRGAVSEWEAQEKHQWPLTPLSKTSNILNLYPSRICTMILSAEGSKQGCIKDNLKKQHLQPTNVTSLSCRA